MNKEIKYIGISELYAHPDNPRKDVGDVTELAESIKASGILQNLTVINGHRQTVQEYLSAADERGISKADALVEWSKIIDKEWLDSGYTVIIGHRRLAAAKAAGLSELPCIVCEMPYNEQISTMLCENMQRRDLTILEEVDGIQLMLDLGETVESISEKTGLSKSTIYKRRNMAAYDREKLRESLERGPKLEDYAELEKIEDPDEREKVLERIGTPNFRYSLNEAIQKQERKELAREAREYLLTFAREILQKEVTSGMVYEKYSSLENVREKFADLPADTKYYFVMSSYSVNLYREKSADELAEEEKASSEKAADMERKERLKAAFKNAFKSRMDFIKKFTPSAAKGRAIDAGLLRYLGNRECTESIFSEIVGILPNEDGDIEYEDIISGKFNYPLKKAVVAALYSAMDGENLNCIDYWDKYSEDETLKDVYTFLEGLGYEMSDEERALMDGTHDLYGGNGNEN